MKGRSHKWSKAELRWVQAHAKDVRSVAHAEFQRRFERPEITIQAYASLCKRMGWLTGRDGRYVKGGVPSNKGKPCREGQGGRHPNAQRTQFKAGREPHNTKHLGHERVSKDGYTEISVAETNPHTGYGRRYVLKHRWLWEQVNGSVPKGMALKCLDGNRLNTDPANWIAVPRGIIPRLAGRWQTVAYDGAPDELKPAILAAAKIKHKAKEVRK